MSYPRPRQLYTFINKDGSKKLSFIRPTRPEDKISAIINATICYKCGDSVYRMPAVVISKNDDKRWMCAKCITKFDIYKYSMIHTNGIDMYQYHGRWDFSIMSEDDLLDLYCDFYHRIGWSIYGNINDPMVHILDILDYRRKL